MKSSLYLSFKLSVLIILTLILPDIILAQWSAPINISPNAVSAGLNESMGSCIGVSGDTLHVVWTDKLSSTNAVIYYTRSLDTGLTWSKAIAITDINGNAWNPAIAVNGLNVHDVWRVIDPLNNAHRSSWYKHSLDGGDTWGATILLDDNIADWPAVTVSGKMVYVANDINTSASPYNTEIFFLRSEDNGATWRSHQQLTFADGRSEDEAISAQGSYVHMSWNDNRSGAMQILYKQSSDYGVTWGPDVLLNPRNVYSTMVYTDGANVEVPSAGSPTNHYQIHLRQSADTGKTWETDKNLTNDTLHNYYYPYIVRDGSDLHLTYIKVGVGGQYLHSGDGGKTWDMPFTFFSGSIGITAFVAFSGCVLHIIYYNVTDHHIYYLRNPTGNCKTVTGAFYYDNAGKTPISNTVISLTSEDGAKVHTATTDALGNYIFNNLSAGAYKFKVFIFKKWGGADPLDALMVNRNYINLYEFNDSLLAQAADVNLDNQINSLDALLINRRFIELINSFKSGDWLFDANIVNIRKSTILNFKAICTGDVNGSFKPDMK